MVERPEKSNVNLFSFAEIVHGRESSVRITDDGLLFAIDLVMVMTGKDRHHSAKTLRRLNEDVFKSDKLCERYLSKKGGPITRLISFRDALELVMVLPGKKASETRVQFSSIIQRHLDQTKNPGVNATHPPLIAHSSRRVGKRCRKEINFIYKAFDLQSEALELRLKHKMQRLKNDDETVEIEALKNENNETDIQIKEMEIELEHIRIQQQDVTSRLKEHMDSLQILSAPYIDE